MSTQSSNGNPEKNNKYQTFFDGIKVIIKKSQTLFLELIIPIFIINLVLSIIAASIWFLLADLTGISENYYRFLQNVWQITERYEQIVKANPDYILPFELQETLNNASLYQIIFTLSRLISVNFIVIGLYLLTSKLILETESNNSKLNLQTSILHGIHSIQSCFSSWRFLFISIGFWVLMTILTPLLLLIFIYPGIIFMINRLYIPDVIHSKEEDDFHPLKEAKYYSNHRFVRLATLILIFQIIPLIIGFILQSVILPWLFNSPNPAGYYIFFENQNIQFGIIFLYQLCYYLIISICMLFFPIIYHVSFLQSKKEINPFKYEDYIKKDTQRYSNVDFNTAPIQVYLDVSQELYKCEDCNTDIPIALKFCPNCGKRYRISYH